MTALSCLSPISRPLPLRGSLSLSLSSVQPSSKKRWRFAMLISFCFVFSFCFFSFLFFSSLLFQFPRPFLRSSVATTAAHSTLPLRPAGGGTGGLRKSTNPHGRRIFHLPSSRCDVITANNLVESWHSSRWLVFFFFFSKMYVHGDDIPSTGQQDRAAAHNVHLGIER